MAPTDAEIKATIKAVVDDFRGWDLAPIMHYPNEEGLEFEDIYFPSDDGVPLEGWFIPCKGSNKIIIANHPHWFNRAGIPSHLEPWNQLMPGNDFEVNFIPDYKILHDAGYNVLAYDLRNHGLSGSGNQGLFGFFEWRDVLGSLKYIRGRDYTKDMTIGLFSRCAGANATLSAMRHRPEAFKGVRCMIAPQPISAGSSIAVMLDKMGAPASYMEEADRQFFMKTSFHISQLSPPTDAKHAKVPTFVYQVRDDPCTTPKDVQSVYDNIPIQDKKLKWIEGTDKRWDGYTYFQREPDQFLEWFAKYMN
ncbi:putative gibberellin biosynthesis-related [Fusarium sp. NRRL 25303]|nr:putative gibberellin biosynthesis-related [Fusarium sp. NRRL 25303]